MQTLPLSYTGRGRGEGGRGLALSYREQDVQHHRLTVSAHRHQLPSQLALRGGERSLSPTRARARLLPAQGSRLLLSSDILAHIRGGVGGVVGEGEGGRLGGEGRGGGGAHTHAALWGVGLAPSPQPPQHRGLLGIGFPEVGRRQHRHGDVGEVGGGDAHPRDALLAHVAAAQATLHGPAAEEAEPNLHTQEAESPLSHVLLNGEVQRQRLEVCLRQHAADVDDLF